MSGRDDEDVPATAHDREPREVSESAAAAGSADRHGSDETSYAVRLERSTRGLLELSMRVLGEVEEAVSPSHLRALQALGSLGGGGRVSALADELGALPSTASRISDRLTAAGLATREIARDNRRATWLQLTPAGAAVLDELVQARVKALARVAERMPPAQRDALLAGTEAFTAACATDNERDATP